MSRDDRQKASDVFRESNPLLGKTSSFSEAFPEIETLGVEVTEKGDDVRGLRGERGERTYHFTHERPPGEYVDCSNDICYNGGFRIASHLRHMTRQRETEGEFSATCQGYEGSPKGQKKYGPCMHHFEAEIEITYKDDADTD